ncbi:hypothetical protein TREES_T100018498 [Tupaia chinensis]|uniref:Uncharacterized protein n=1 Tax=Tupaia chinensis TaxID=246437 RepID=L9KXJ1_TUPCH|nr:hypothetical protein TREES_T100018498 [Tupaia chinensis]
MSPSFLTEASWIVLYSSGLNCPEAQGNTRLSQRQATSPSPGPSDQATHAVLADRQRLAVLPRPEHVSLENTDDTATSLRRPWRDLSIILHRVGSRRSSFNSKKSRDAVCATNIASTVSEENATL